MVGAARAAAMHIRGRWVVQIVVLGLKSLIGLVGIVRPVLVVSGKRRKWVYGLRTHGSRAVRRGSRVVPLHTRTATLLCCRRAWAISILQACDVHRRGRGIVARRGRRARGGRGRGGQPEAIRMDRLGGEIAGLSLGSVESSPRSCDSVGGCRRGVGVELRAARRSWRSVFSTRYSRALAGF